MIIGITGKSGSGKTTMINILNENNNYEVICADEVAHLVLEIDEFKEKLVSLYGEVILTNGKVDRKILGRIIFEDKEEMDKYNKSIWVYIEKYIDGVINNSKKDIIIDWMQLPLTKYLEMSDIKILMEAPLSLRIKRVMERDSINEDYFKSREENRLEYDRSQYDFVVVNDGEILREKASGIKFMVKEGVH